MAQTINKDYAVIKETERGKYLPSQIVKLLNEGGYPNFTIRAHTLLWKEMDAKNPKKNFGVLVAGKTWYWYERWLDVVKDYCSKNAKQPES